MPQPSFRRIALIGKLRSAEVAGLTVDVGAEAMLARRPEGLALATEIGAEVVHPTAATSAVWSRGALRTMPRSLIEAARVDGANEPQIFWRIIVPMVSLPIAVVSVTLIVNVIKLFDLIYVMTAGGPGASSRVIAFSMYQEAFPQGQFGYGATIAIVMLLLLVPVMIFNIRRFRAEAVQQ